MIDLSHRTIKTIFEKQVLELTKKAFVPKEDIFDFQLSGGWLQ